MAYMPKNGGQEEENSDQRDDSEVRLNPHGRIQETLYSQLHVKDKALKQSRQLVLFGTKPPGQHPATFGNPSLID